MAKGKATTGQKIKVWFEKYLLLKSANEERRESEEAEIITTPPAKLVRQGAVLDLLHDFHFDEGEINVIGNSLIAAE
ncbi:MAG: hypothetical protein H0U78_03930 [Rickettsiaceae bacterium]|jgi:hypothetical protein|nr:hypothetical protein [Rickettsiaceae bacterium]